MTSSDATSSGSPSSPRYWNSSWPGRSRQRRTIAASRRSRKPDLVGHAGLAAEPEADRGAANRRVTVAERRQPERAVQPGVLVVADPDQRQLEQADDRREDLLAGQARPAEVAVDLLADRRQRPGERDEPLVLRRFAPGPVSGGGSGNCLRPRASRPVAWRWPSGSGQIQTSVQAGGIASDRIRSSVSRSRIRRPSGSTYVKPRPARRRLMPGSRRSSGGGAALVSVWSVTGGGSPRRR